jgi:uncharacterized protein YabN with tetrapyrrole methylase and pyrophosphatase domain
VLFQVCFLALLLEERGAGSLAAVAEAITAKLIRRHPHVFGPGAPNGQAEDRPAADPGAPGIGDVLRNWDRIKREVEGRGGAEPFADVPENLPGLLYARKIQRRAVAAGLAGDQPTDRKLAPLERDAAERWLGDALFGLVDVARRLRIDPELAVRAAAERFREEAGRGA